MKRELIPCARGLILCLLAGIDEGNIEKTKEIDELLNEIMKSIGRR